jgi:hypothetical protein
MAIYLSTMTDSQFTAAHMVRGNKAGLPYGCHSSHTTMMLPEHTTRAYPTRRMYGHFVQD